MKKYFKKIIFTAAFVCLTSSTMMAQEDFEDDTGDVPAAAIDFYTPLLLISALGIGCYFFLGKSKIKQ